MSIAWPKHMVWKCPHCGKPFAVVIYYDVTVDVDGVYIPANFEADQAVVEPLAPLESTQSSKGDLDE